MISSEGVMPYAYHKGIGSEASCMHAPWKDSIVVKQVYYLLYKLRLLEADLAKLIDRLVKSTRRHQMYDMV